MSMNITQAPFTDKSFNPRRLEEAREAKGLTMAELARVLDISRQAISSFEKGLKSPSADTLSAIAKVLGFPERFSWPPMPPHFWMVQFILEVVQLRPKRLELQGKHVGAGRR